MPRNYPERNNRERESPELWAALIAILGITLAYALATNARQGIPAAGSLFGHAIGALGFLLMLMTETLYTLRKRSRLARWGRMSGWLQFHIFTGIVGPYMVLLHSSWKFNGLAGVLMLFTVVIVASGFFGRYIYTAIPRTVDGAEVSAGELEHQAQAAEAELIQLMAAQPEAARLSAVPLAALTEGAGTGAGLVFERAYRDWKLRWQWRQARKGLPEEARPQAAQLEELQLRRRALERQLASLADTRRMLSLWHSVHVPVGVALFTLGFIHAAAVIYFISALR